MEPIQLLKTYEKICIKVSDFYMNIINNKLRLLYNLPTIQSIQLYNGLCELTNYIIIIYELSNFGSVLGVV